jgi:hypothetical protein
LDLLSQEIVKSIIKQEFSGFFRFHSRVLDLGLRVHHSSTKKNLLTVEQLKEVITENLEDIVLIADRFNQWTPSLKGWVEDLHEQGRTVLLLSTDRELNEFLIRIPVLNLPPLSKQQMQKIIWWEGLGMDMMLTPQQVGRLANRAKGNPLLAKRLVREIKQGIHSENINNWDVWLIWGSAGLMLIARLLGVTGFYLHLHLLLFTCGSAIALFFIFRLIDQKFGK